jgi:hypothetical protein
MTSMENFFNWMSKPIPKEDIVIWFNVHNMNYEKIELFGDVFKSLNQVVHDTYMGEDISETKISMSSEDKELHFEWCWKKTVDDFRTEGIEINSEGDHKDYNPTEKNVREAIPNFLSDVFDVEKAFTKSDLDILTELYKLLEKNIE